MSCTSSPTATEYATLTTYSLTTVFSAVTSLQSFQATVAQQSCAASGTIGSTVGCISTATQLNTIDTTTAQVNQVAVTSTVPVVITSPTKTLYGTDCSSGATQPAAQSSSPTPTSSSATAVTPVTTSVLVEITPPPSTVVTASSTTLANGSVVQTVVTFVSTLPATEVYQPSTVATSASSDGSGTNATPIIAGVVGGVVGLLAIAILLIFCRRRRRSWDDIFEKEHHEDPDAMPIPVRPQRDRMLDLSGSYELVGHGSQPGSPRASISLHHPSDPHGRNMSLSAVPLISAGNASRPSTRGTAISHYSAGSVAPLIDTVQSIPTAQHSQVVLTGDVNRTGSPVPESERLVLRVINKSDPPQPGPSHDVIVHTDAGRVVGPSSDPPAYSPQG